MATTKKNARKSATKSAAKSSARKPSSAKSKAAARKPVKSKPTKKTAPRLPKAPAIPLKNWRAGDKVRFVEDGNQVGKLLTVMKLNAYEKKYAPPLNKFVPIEEWEVFVHVSDLSKLDKSIARAS